MTVQKCSERIWRKETSRDSTAPKYIDGITLPIFNIIIRTYFTLPLSSTACTLRLIALNSQTNFHNFTFNNRNCLSLRPMILIAHRNATSVCNSCEFIKLKVDSNALFNYLQCFPSTERKEFWHVVQCYRVLETRLSVMTL